MAKQKLNYRIQVSLNKEIFDKLNKISFTNGISLSNLCRLIINSKVLSLNGDFVLDLKQIEIQ